MRVAEALRTLLDEAHVALGGGDPAEAERRAKAVSALVRAERELAEFAAAAATAVAEEDGERMRAELFSRLDRLADAARQGAPEEVLERLARETAV